MTRSSLTRARIFAATVAGSLVLATGGQAQPASDTDGFREIRVAPGLATGADFIDVLTPFFKGHPESEEGNAALDLRVRKAGSGFRVDIVLTGYLDDSLVGEHFRGTVIRTDRGNWELLTMGVKPICARGTNIDGVCTTERDAPAMFLTPGAAPNGVSMCVTIAPGDVLNVRQGPGARFAATGALAAGSCDVEVSTVCEGSWCEIRSGAISGWVNTRYLEPAN
ncbi:SH3 domain-containing protein [Roseibium sp. M-1]